MSPEKQRLQDVMDASLPAGVSLVVLEAGCGSRRHVRSPSDAHLVGLEISAR